MHKVTRMITVILAAGFPVASGAADDTTVFATVNDSEISQRQFELEVYNQARQTYYHGRPNSEAELLEFRRQVADKLVDRVLLLEEARVRGIEPNHNEIASQLAVYEDRYSDTERWQTEGDAMLARVRQRLEEDSILETFEAEVRDIDGTDAQVVREFYEAQPEKFTQPEQIRVSVIMLALAPSSPGTTWEAARREAAEISAEIRAGGSFEEFARLRSADQSASQGGDMGYLHAGMLSDAAQSALDELDVGAVSDPVTVLEGVAIFKLTDRREAALQPFAAVQQRAAELWRRDEGERQWQNTITELRSRSKISLDEAYLRALPATNR